MMLVQVLEVLHTGIESFRSGTASSWMIVSSRVHQLLTDHANGHTPLARRVIRDLRLHPLKHTLDLSAFKYIEAVPVAVSFANDKTVVEPFDLSKVRIPLANWLSQTAYVRHSQPILLKEIVERTRHKLGGGHFDDEVDQTTTLVEGVLGIFSTPRGPLSFRDYIVGVGEYVYTELQIQLMLGLGNYHRSQGAFEHAEEFYQTALQRAEQAEDLQGQVEILLARSYLESLRCNSGSGAVLAERALGQADTMGWTEGRVSAAHNASALRFDCALQLSRSSPERAIEQYKKAVTSAVIEEDTLVILSALANMTQLQLGASKLEEAISLLVLSSQVVAKSTNVKGLGEVIRKLRHLARQVDPSDPAVIAVASAIESSPKEHFSSATTPKGAAMGVFPVDVQSALLSLRGA